MLPVGAEYQHLASVVGHIHQYARERREIFPHQKLYVIAAIPMAAALAIPFSQPSCTEGSRRNCESADADAQ